jgi:hypothetical protein
MNEEWSQIAANGIIHEASKAFAEWADAAWQQTRPSVLFRPAISADGTMWCALLGDNLQEGVAGFGETPEAAMRAFDKAWTNERTPKAIARAPGDSQ